MGRGTRAKSTEITTHTRVGGLVGDGLVVVKILLAAVCPRVTFRHVLATLLTWHTRRGADKSIGCNEERRCGYVCCAELLICVSLLY